MTVDCLFHARHLVMCMACLQGKSQAKPKVWGGRKKKRKKREKKEITGNQVYFICALLIPLYVDLQVVAV
jgi:hypothetical protein